MNNKVQIISREIFYVLTGAAVIFALFEAVWPGAVLSRLSYGWLLIFWLFDGILMLSLIREK